MYHANNFSTLPSLHFQEMQPEKKGKNVKIFDLSATFPSEIVMARDKQSE